MWLSVDIDACLCACFQQEEVVEARPLGKCAILPVSERTDIPCCKMHAVELCLS